MDTERKNIIQFKIYLQQEIEVFIEQRGEEYLKRWPELILSDFGQWLNGRTRGLASFETVEKKQKSPVTIDKNQKTGNRDTEQQIS